jgi:signal transduction histidine kinase
LKNSPSKILPFPFWKALLAAAALCALLIIRQYLWYWNETTSMQWFRYASVPVVNYFLWAFLLPVIYWVYRFLRKRSSMANRVLLFALIGACISVFHETFSYVLYYVPLVALGVEQWNHEVLNLVLMKIPGNIFARFIEFSIIMGVFFAIDSYRRTQEQKIQLVTLENQLTTAQLQSLRAKLQPHFLFNTLNTIGALVEEDRTQAQKMIARLGQLLRHILDRQDRQLITLEEEMTYVEDYLAIEQTRFSDRLQIHYNIAPEARKFLVPNLLLQPLIENAIRHGIAPKPEGGSITIFAQAEPGYLRLEITDDGIGMETVDGWT